MSMRRLLLSNDQKTENRKLYERSKGPMWLTTRMRTRSSGQCVSGATCSATLSFPSCLSPIFHCTKPPYILLQALPEPWRATSDSSASTPNKRDSEYTESDTDTLTPCYKVITSTYYACRVAVVRLDFNQFCGIRLAHTDTKIIIQQ